MAQSKIDYVHSVWNPVTGCDPVSPGCDHCYARRMAKRLRGRHGYPADDPFRVTLHPDRLGEPLRWRKARRIFTVSMGDLFHGSVPNAYRAAMWSVMAACPQHRFMVLTKRPDEMARWFEWVGKREKDGMALFPDDEPEWRIWQMLHVEGRKHGVDLPAHHGGTWPLPNVWLGTTVCVPEELPKVETLLGIPAALHWVSLEPLLWSVRLTHIGGDGLGRGRLNALAGLRYIWEIDTEVRREWEASPTAKLGLVVCGGESGPGARPMNPVWVQQIRDDCQEYRVPFWFKQWGEWRAGESKDFLHYPEDTSTGHYMVRCGRKEAGNLLDGVRHEEMPR